MTNDARLALPALPMPFRPLGEGRFDLNGERLELEAGPRSDWFLPPGDETASTMNAFALLGEVEGDYTLSARVEVAFGATFDAGALVAYAEPNRWGKLAFEYSPDRERMIVSVVTRGRSDDANGFTVDNRCVWLRIARLGSEYAFHASTDGSRWQLIRHFALEEKEQAKLGFEVQSPTGEGCTATFDEIAFARHRLGDLRDGS